MIAVAILLTVAISCKEKDHVHADTYICPMHPTVVSDRPSTCPVCGMDLVRKARPGEEVKITENLARLLKSPNEIVIANIKTVKSEFKSMTTTIEATGIVTYDTRNIHTISSRIAGRLENVYLKYNFQPVQKEQKIAEIYSPELQAAQKELLFLIDQDVENTTLIDAAKEKLYLLGATKEQVEATIKSKEVTFSFAVYSPVSGYVVGNTAESLSVDNRFSNISSNSSIGMGGNMGSASTERQTNNVSNSSELIRVGNYVNVGETLFKVVNTSSLRVELNLPVSQSANIKANNPIALNFGDGDWVTAKIDFVQPFFKEGEELNKIRVYVDGRDLRVGQLVEASINLKTPEMLWIPKKAVLDLGNEWITFVMDKGSFKPKKVTTGIQTNEWIEIKQGLLSTDEVAENAQYLVDSESFIKTK